MLVDGITRKKTNAYVLHRINTWGRRRGAAVPKCCQQRALAAPRLIWGRKSRFPWAAFPRNKSSRNE